MTAAAATFPAFLEDYAQDPATAVPLAYVEGVPDGRAFFEHASQLGVEGVISKRLDGSYQQTRSRSWLKIKCRQSDEFTIVGYSPSAAAAGAIIAGLIEGAGLETFTPVGLTFDQIAGRMNAVHRRPAVGN